MAKLTHREIFEALLAGKRVRNPVWCYYEYVHLNADGWLLDECGDEVALDIIDDSESAWAIVAPRDMATDPQPGDVFMSLGVMCRVAHVLNVDGERVVVCGRTRGQVKLSPEVETLTEFTKLFRTGMYVPGAHNA